MIKLDKYEKKTKKTYRVNTNINYKTISLTLDKILVNFLEKVTEKINDKNMSQFIENNVFNSNVIEMPKRRKFKTFPIKKTFTFSEKFVKEIKKSGNMSLFIETILIKKFNIK